ncbi:MAG TPA: hypothetical protein VLH09_14530, partial [Bryobacteraceae bacterium]|nr:hypothetical protein [Bryobacteraceae bacterium]
RDRGLEAALESLCAAGVYLTHEEFKGRTPLVRSGKEIPASAAAFDNPSAPGFIESTSGGTSGKPTPTRISAASQTYREAYALLRQQDLGLAGRVQIQVRPLLPSPTGLLAGISFRRSGNPVSDWFAPPGRLRDSGHYTAVTLLLVSLARARGAGIPFPKFLPENDFSPVARRIAECRGRRRPVAVFTYASSAVRVAAAARDLGLDIEGTLFVSSGEALTGAKRAAIEAAGCAAYPTYWINEIGPVGFCCGQVRSGNCVHLFRDSLAAILRKRVEPLSGAAVGALALTTLQPLAPRFLINTEAGDTGALETADCDCVYSRAGLTTRIADIASFGKLTGQGMNVAGEDIVRILEESLPARFGGAPGDYQLIEREGGSQTQLLLRVSPRTGCREEAVIAEYFLNRLRSEFGGTLAARVWQHAGAFQVVLEEPLRTSLGKVQPLVLLRMEGRATHGS